jgi:hypothetical protein
MLEWAACRLPKQPSDQALTAQLAKEPRPALNVSGFGGNSQHK